MREESGQEHGNYHSGSSSVRFNVSSIVKISRVWALWSPQLNLGASFTVVIKECAHKCNPLWSSSWKIVQQKATKHLL